MNLTQPQEICIFRGQMEMEEWPNLVQHVNPKVEETMTSAGIDVEMVCPLRTPNIPPGTHGYNPKRHGLIEGLSKYMITREEAQVKLSGYHDAQGTCDEVYTDGSKINERVGAAAVINRHFQNGEMTCHCPVPTLLQRRQPSPWHWTIICTWILYSTMS